MHEGLTNCEAGRPSDTPLKSSTTVDEPPNLAIVRPRITKMGAVGPNIRNMSSHRHATETKKIFKRMLTKASREAEARPGIAHHSILSNGAPI